MTNKSSYDALAKDILLNKEARVAATENALRRDVAGKLYSIMLDKKISIKELISQTEKSKIQIHRLMNIEKGGNLYLSTLVSAADRLGLKLKIVINEKD